MTSAQKPDNHRAAAIQRRHFLGELAAVGIAPAVWPSAEGVPRAPLAPPEAPASGQPNSRLAGYTLAQLRGLYHRDLFIDWLPFMEQHVIDHEYGGFLCNTGFDGTHVNFDKDPLFEGRGIWVYSYLFTHFGKDARYLEVARRSVELLRKSQPQRGSLWCSKIARDGSPLAPPGALIPTDLGIAEGFAAYAQATGQQQYLDQAKELFRKCVEVYDRPDYYPGPGRRYLGLATPVLPGPRILGTWMLLLRAAAQILEIHADAYVRRVAGRSIEAVIDRHYNPEFRLNNELLNHDLSRPPGPYFQLCNLGNTFEITWMLLDEALRRRDEAMFDECAGRFQRHAAVAWDQVYGGAFSTLLNVDENRFVLNKLLWVQEEVLIDSLYIYARRGAVWAADAFGRMYRYVRERYPLKAYGSPLWMYATGRQATFEEFRVQPKRVENYHHPRHLMFNLRRIGAMLAKGHQRTSKSR